MKEIEIFRSVPSKRSFRDWKIGEGNRLYHVGPEAMNTTELIAYLIRDHHLAERLMARFKSLKALSQATLKELQEIPGLGEARAEMIKVAFELGKRLATTASESRLVVSSPRDVVNLLMPELRHLEQEVFKALILNTKNKILKIETISVGSLDKAIVRAREVFKPAVRISGACIIGAHNHPSGDPTPSDEDIYISRTLKQSGEILGIDLLDHIIIGDGTYISLKEQGLI
jgi:DNA repair protein RadC